MLETTKVLKQTELLGQQFEVYGTPQEPLFKAQDVAAMLSLTNVSDMMKRVDEDEATKLNLGSQSGETWMLTEKRLVWSVDAKPKAYRQAIQERG